MEAARGGIEHPGVEGSGVSYVVPEKERAGGKKTFAIERYWLVGNSLGMRT